MIGEPDRPPARGGTPGRAARASLRPLLPVRYVGGLLLWQGLAWLLLAAAALVTWIVVLPAGLETANSAPALLRTSSELLAIAVGASLGAGEVVMACRLRGGPRLVLAMAVGVRGATMAAGIVVAAVTVMIGGSVLQLLALNGAF